MIIIITVLNDIAALEPPVVPRTARARIPHLFLHQPVVLDQVLTQRTAIINNIGCGLHVDLVSLAPNFAKIIHGRHRAPVDDNGIARVVVARGPVPVRVLANGTHARTRWRQRWAWWQWVTRGGGCTQPHTSGRASPRAAHTAPRTPRKHLLP